MTDRERVRLLREALTVCAATFRAYEALHREKVDQAGPLDDISEFVRKSKANRDHAITCERVLVATQR